MIVMTFAAHIFGYDGGAQAAGLLRLAARETLFYAIKCIYRKPLSMDERSD